jgi:hypothetical protein
MGRENNIRLILAWVNGKWPRLFFKNGLYVSPLALCLYGQLRCANRPYDPLITILTFYWVAIPNHMSFILICDAFYFMDG